MNRILQKITFLISLLLVTSLGAQIVTVQGVLRDNNNAAISDGEYTMSFDIYSTEIGVLERFSALQPVSFTANIDGNDTNGYGFRGENMRSVFPELIRELPGRTLEDGSITKTKEGLDVTSFAVQSVGAINELKVEKDVEIEKLIERIEDLENK